MVAAVVGALGQSEAPVAADAPWLRTMVEKIGKKRGERRMGKRVKRAPLFLPRVVSHVAKFRSYKPLAGAFGFLVR